MARAKNSKSVIVGGPSKDTSTRIDSTSKYNNYINLFINFILFYFLILINFDLTVFFFIMKKKLKR